MTNVRLRFTGELATTFQEPGVGSVEPQGEFEVPEDRAEAFTRRADIEVVSGGRSRARRSSGDQGSGDDPNADAGDSGTDLGERGALTETGAEAGDPDPATLV